jgi:hypothetical protein
MSNPSFIPLIHNYCDRWCERCTMGSRCSLYEGNMAKENTVELDNEAFWKKMADQFAATIDLLRQSAANHGLDLDNIPEDIVKEVEQQQEQVQVKMQEHPLKHIPGEYMKSANDLLEAGDLLEESGAELIQQLELGLQHPDIIQQKATEIQECVDVIQWYETIIPSKLGRALYGKLEDEADGDVFDEQGDANGSAKVAMMAIDRSLQAWALLLQALPKHEDDIIPVLALLQKTRQLTVSEFPNYEKFVRPGFDTEGQ